MKKKKTEKDELELKVESEAETEAPAVAEPARTMSPEEIDSRYQAFLAKTGG